MNEWMKKWIHEWMNEWMINKWMNEWMNEWIDRIMNFYWITSFLRLRLEMASVFAWKKRRWTELIWTSFFSFLFFFSLFQNISFSWISFSLNLFHMCRGKHFRWQNVLVESEFFAVFFICNTRHWKPWFFLPYRRKHLQPHPDPCRTGTLKEGILCMDNHECMNKWIN